MPAQARIPSGAVLVLLALAGATLAIPLRAEDTQPGASDKFGYPVKRGAVVSFSSQDTMIIKQYYRTSRGTSTLSSLNRKKRLAPAFQKHLVKRGTLPSGLAKRALPIDLENRLSSIPLSYQRWLVGTDVVLVDRNRIIQDLVVNALP
jgi:hypothetical protein